MHMKFVRARRFNLAVTLLLALAAPTLSNSPAWGGNSGQMR
jgi:hypothetical protein